MGSLKKFLYKLNKSKYVYINITICVILYFIIINLSKYSYLTIHEYIYPYINGFVIRIPAQIGSFLFINFLPKLFNINPNDFKAIGFGGLVLFPFVYFLIIHIFSKGFFLTSYPSLDNEDKIGMKIFCKKEYAFAITYSFLFLTTMLKYCNFHNSVRILDTVITTDYFVSYIFFFSLFIILYKLIFIEKNQKNKELLIYSFISFIVGAWNEYFHFNVLFTIVILSIILFFYEKSRLKNKYLLFIIFPLILGIISYYLFGSNYIKSFSLIDDIQSNLLKLPTFTSNFVKFLIIDKFVYLIIISILTIILLIKKTEGEEKNKNIIIYCFSMIFGLLLTNYMMIFTQGVYDSVPYLFERPDTDTVNLNILEYIILVLTGAVYYQYKNCCKYLLTIYFICLIPICVQFIKFSKYVINNTRINKSVIFDLEMRCVIFNSIGEISYLPESYLHNNILLEQGIIFPYDTSNGTLKFKTGKIYDGEYYSPYMKYFKHVYGTNLKGIVWLPDEIADEILNKRLLLINDELKNYKNRQYSFKKLYKKFYKREITISDLHNNKTNDLSDIMLKTKANIKYKEGNFLEAMNLYEEYLKKYNDKDIDVLYSLANIYDVLKKYAKAKEIKYKLKAQTE